MKDNIPGWPCYHISKEGRVINRKSYRDENID